MNNPCNTPYDGDRMCYNVVSGVHWILKKQLSLEVKKIYAQNKDGDTVVVFARYDTGCDAGRMRKQSSR